MLMNGFEGLIVNPRSLSTARISSPSAPGIPRAIGTGRSLARPACDVPPDYSAHDLALIRKSDRRVSQITGDSRFPSQQAPGRASIHTGEHNDYANQQASYTNFQGTNR